MRVTALLVAGALLSAAAGGPAASGSRGPRPDAWPNGLDRDPAYFPIAVWLQSPGNAARYSAAGINLYVGLWEGPTEAQLSALRAAQMRVICEQNAVGLAHRNDRTIAGWMHGDEPDNAQPMRDPKTGEQTWGPCVPPPRIVEDYRRLRAADPTRPILLNLGQGVANDRWVGRRAGASLDDYRTYVKGSDIVSFDVYPIAGLGKESGPDLLWYIGKGLDRLRDWTGGGKPVWNCIECTAISGEGRKPTPDEVASEVWMSLIHGSRGLVYFVHQFAPTFNEHALLDDPAMLAGVTRVNARIRRLAPVLNAPTLPDAVTPASSDPRVPVDVLAKEHGGSLYLFAIGMRNRPTRATLTIRGRRGLPAEAEVLDEGRRVPIRDGALRDDFGPYQVHIYRVRLAAR